MNNNEKKEIKNKKPSKDNTKKKKNTKSNLSTNKKQPVKTNNKKEIKQISKKTNQARNKRRNRSKNKKTYNKQIEKIQTNKTISKNKIKQTPKNIKSRNRRKKGNKKKKIILFVIIILFIIISIGAFFGYNYIKEKEKQEAQTKLQEDIISHYNKYVITTKETELYKLEEEKYIKSGKLTINQELELEEIKITYKDEYLKVLTFTDEEYYIYYKDVKPLEELSKISDRYKRYIPFNENVITKEITNFYNEENTLVYSFNKSFELPIIIKEIDKYGIEYNNRLLYINKEDVSETKESNNTDKTNTKGIAVFNYHFFYDETQSSERAECNQSICHSTRLFESHLKYIKENEIFTPTMKEFEMYLDKKINLPKSVLITIDDGWRSNPGEELLEKYKLNGTTFLITSWFDKIDFLNKYEYVEFHSHGDNLHNQGVCPGGQGGGIKCIEKNKLQADLKLSREKLGGSTVFCYPFYEYNSYSIQNLKETGFTMAFRGGFKKATPGVNKYEIPRYVIYNNTSVSTIASYIN